MSYRTAFRATAQWEPATGTGGEYPGLEPRGPAQAIPVADRGLKVITAGEDRVQRRVYWTLPEHDTRPGGLLSGHRIGEVAEVRDAAGALLYRVAYAEA